jgi:hypothetical protein
MAFIVFLFLFAERRVAPVTHPKTCNLENLGTSGVLIPNGNLCEVTTEKTMFAERYLQALSTSNLQDDDQHHQTEPLVAAALADLSGGAGALFGTMLLRASIAGVPRQAVESSARDLGVLLRVWTGEVARKGFERKWMNIKAEWDIKAAYAMYAKIARVSLAHWLGGECSACNGTKVVASRVCAHCAGTGREPIKGGALEVEHVKDMVSELQGMHQAHSARARARLRKVA